MRNNIAQVRRRGYKRKIPRLVVMLKSCTSTESDASSVFKDPSGAPSAARVAAALALRTLRTIAVGEMPGTIHRQVLHDFEMSLACGAVLVLRDVRGGSARGLDPVRCADTRLRASQVAVFSPSPRSHYLNVTPDNIVHIFPSETAECASTTVRSTCADAPGPLALPRLAHNNTAAVNVAAPPALVRPVPTDVSDNGAGGRCTDGVASDDSDLADDLLSSIDLAPIHAASRDTAPGNKRVRNEVPAD